MDDKIINLVKETKKRENNLDFLRILCMIMILILHYLGKGGLLEKENVGSTYFAIYYMIESLAMVSVNCYVLISGYFLVKSDFKIKKFFKLWGEVIFYSITIYLMLLLFGLKEFNIKDLIKSCFPVLTKQYWFVNTYLAMYLLSPFINKLIYTLNRKEYKQLLLIIISIFSAMSILPLRCLLDTTGGYGIIWFICLYLIAGYVRIFIQDENIIKHKSKFLIIYFLSAILTTLAILILQPISNTIGNKLLKYNMPLVLVESMAIFMYFKCINIKNKYINKMIMFMAPLTFGVYLIHEQPVFSTILYKDILHTEICYHNTYGILIVLCSSIIMFLACILIEYIRIKIMSFLKERKKLNKK